MHAAPEKEFDMDAQGSFKIVFAYLNAQVKYIFSSPKMKPDTWCVVYWSIRVQRSSIMKMGTETDKARIPEPTKKYTVRKQKV